MCSLHFRKIKKEEFTIRTEIQKVLQKVGDEVSKDAIKRSLNHTGLCPLSPRQTPILEPKM